MAEHQGPGDVRERLESYRRTREQVERSILPRATSVDGYAFTVQASLHGLQLRRGGYVVLEAEDQHVLGQVTDLTAEAEIANDATGAGIDIRLARGTGVTLGDTGRPFHDAHVRAATAEEVGAWLSRTPSKRAQLVIGELLHAPGVPAALDSGGLGRHTFMCGQSGSGKTYSLGLLIESVLAGTDLPVVVLDPNSDYIRLGTVRDGADPERVATYPADAVKVWGDHTADHPLRVRFADLDAALQAAVLELEPVRDRDEYAALTDLLHGEVPGKPLLTGVDDLLEHDDPAARQLGRRAKNLGILDWGVWSRGGDSLVDELRHPTARCLVVDLGSLGSPQEQRLVAAAVLATLWEQRLRHRPCLVVVDEAHNICPADPPDELTRIAADHAVQIAAEGRKFGLYMLTSTQRPHKVDENVVSQCDNLLLMRMNSAADLGDLAQLFSFVPPGLFAGATAFRMGHALVAGRIVPQPAYVRMGERISEEGGADVPATWAVPDRAAPGSPSPAGRRPDP
ncbi:ATP-binding protein [Georgenia yuyongxinii]|uniref:ATP-binding protein n=1 Tax=Georgenia yuyongxinii TaxID=2589797 RepID=A0A5B8CB07_9MICO|nr:ATP-binding protein [Georgenia yuyongxinii]QDC25316.1 ATP-binding protein [Georgenia yuyongxinii]